MLTFDHASIYTLEKDFTHHLRIHTVPIVSHITMIKHPTPPLPWSQLLWTNVKPLGLYIWKGFICTMPLSFGRLYWSPKHPTLHIFSLSLIMLSTIFGAHFVAGSPSASESASPSESPSPSPSPSASGVLALASVVLVFLYKKSSVNILMIYTHFFEVHSRQMIL